MNKASIVVAIALGFPLSSTQECGFTIHGGPAGPGKPCAFPFKLNGRTFDRCTTVQEGQKRPWCPTSLDAKGRHHILSRAWSYCDPSCPFRDASGNVLTTTASPEEKRKATRRPTQRPKTTRQTSTLATTTRRTTDRSPTTEALGDAESRSGRWLPELEKSQCGFQLATGYILGGVTIARGEYPFMALLGYANTQNIGTTKVLYRCGGSLINRRYVLTAAHCHDANTVRNQIVEVVIGEHDVALDPDCEAGCELAQRFSVEEVVVHENYGLAEGNSMIINDIALVRLYGLAKTVYEDSATPVMTVCLPRPEGSDNVDGFTVLGWGKSSNEDSETDITRLGVANRLPQKLHVDRFDHKQCGLIFPGVTSDQLCAGGVVGQDSCNGDSGGPLVDRQGPNDPMTLYGIVSAGSKRCGIGQPGVYTKVDRYINWIKDNLRE